MRERVIKQQQNFVPVEQLEMLLKARMGWADGIISPFAISVSKRRTSPGGGYSPKDCLPSELRADCSAKAISDLRSGSL
jgi:hypothetical protein